MKYPYNNSITTTGLKLSHTHTHTHLESERERENHLDEQFSFWKVCFVCESSSSPSLSYVCVRSYPTLSHLSLVVVRLITSNTCQAGHIEPRFQFPQISLLPPKSFFFPFQHLKCLEMHVQRERERDSVGISTSHCVTSLSLSHTHTHTLSLSFLFENQRHSQNFRWERSQSNI